MTRRAETLIAMLALALTAFGCVYAYGSGQARCERDKAAYTGATTVTGGC